MSKHKVGLWAIAMACGALLQAPAFAADIPVKALAPAPALIDWSGVYIGLHAGYGGGMTDWTDSSFDYTPRGFLGGGQVGINKQIASLVFGLELDGSWADITGSQSELYSLPFTMRPRTATSSIDGVVTFSARAGLAADRWFVYTKGGLAGAWECHQFNDSGSYFGPPAVFFSDATSGREFRSGPMVGFGAEYALSGNWSVKGEYDFINFGTHVVTERGTTTVAGVTTPFVYDQSLPQQAVHLVKIGANYRWGGLTVDPVYPPVKAEPGMNWTGIYAGLEGGYGRSHTEWPDFFLPTVPGSGEYNQNGWLAGFDGGVNVQSGILVFGVEGEWMCAGLHGSQVISENFSTSKTNYNVHTAIDWLAIASARAGFAVSDHLYFYGKAGFAMAGEKHGFESVTTDSGLVVGTNGAEGRAVHSGIAAGFGIEYALDHNWSVKGEYDYVRMIGQNFTGQAAATFPPSPGQTLYPFQSDAIRQGIYLAKLGVNYRFNPMPEMITTRD